MKKENALKKGIRLIRERVQKRGLWVTGKWIFGRGWTKITGLPYLAHSEITPLIYVGPQLNRAGAKMAEEHGILASVNMRIEYDDAVHGVALPHYCYIPVIDDDTPSFEQIQQGVDFITEQIENKIPVYIHCMGGIGRAPTMASFYFISTGMTLNESIGLIEKSRPYINIMPIQLMQLERYERLRETLAESKKMVEIHTAHDFENHFLFNFYKGMAIDVLKTDDEDPRWLKCRLHNGTEGWTPESYVEKTKSGWKTTKDYNAMEMAVAVGETVTVIEEFQGWAWTEKENHAHGWIPINTYSS